MHVCSLSSQRQDQKLMDLRRAASWQKSIGLNLYHVSRSAFHRMHAVGPIHAKHHELRHADELDVKIRQTLASINKIGKLTATINTPQPFRQQRQICRSNVEAPPSHSILLLSRHRMACIHVHRRRRLFAATQTSRTQTHPILYTCTAGYIIYIPRHDRRSAVSSVQRVLYVPPTRMLTVWRESRVAELRFYNLAQIFNFTLD
jgi:hypothetical protein